jgi:hypothetical protein
LNIGSASRDMRQLRPAPGCGAALAHISTAQHAHRLRVRPTFAGAHLGNSWHLVCSSGDKDVKPLCVVQAAFSGRQLGSRAGTCRQQQRFSVMAGERPDACFSKVSSRQRCHAVIWKLSYVVPDIDKWAALLQVWWMWLACWFCQQFPLQRCRHSPIAS